MVDDVCQKQVEKKGKSQLPSAQNTSGENLVYKDVQETKTSPLLEGEDEKVAARACG